MNKPCDNIISLKVALVSTLHITESDCRRLMYAAANVVSSDLLVRDMGPGSGYFVLLDDLPSSSSGYDRVISVLREFYDRGYDYVWFSSDGGVYSFLAVEEWS